MKNKIFLSWAPVVVWAIIIFSFSSIPTTPTYRIHWQDFIVKKTAHIIEYGILCTLLYRGFKMNGYSAKRAAILSILICFFYGASDEFHQSFTPGRQPTLRDVIIDTIGALLAILIIWNLLPRMPKRLKNLAKDFQLI